MNPQPSPEPIAIIGIGCRFPGGVTGPEGLWRFLAGGGDAIGEIPADRFPLERFYAEQPATPGKVMTRWGGFLEGIERFDAGFFEMSPREAERLDPAQRLLLETAWEALEDGGQLPGSAALLETGVFVGLWLSDFEARLFRDPARVDFHMTTGSGRYSASGRLSYAFGFQGPSLTLDTACSSSLVAVHLAVQSLRLGECRLALAGGANVILQPHITIAYSQSKMMAPDGQCKFGDARADGYVRSEGAALVALKRLSDARADGDPIYALILGSAVNNDGRSSGFLTTPGGAGQEDLLRKAYANAGISPGLVQYVEAHGTGTRAGDPVEIGALGAVLAEGRPQGLGCSVGSVKTNFGHTEGAAGVAGLIKLALSLHHKMLPASLHYTEPNPAIPWEQLPLRIQASCTPWPETPYPKIGGVSAFGIAGTNAHAVLGEAPLPEAGTQAGAPEASPVLLPLSAKSPAALAALAAGHARFLAEAGQGIPSLQDYVSATATRRSHHPYRLALTGQTLDELRQQLASLHEEEIAASAGRAEAAPRRVVFVFPGQGSQWRGMGRQLYASEAVFRRAIDRCAAAFAAWADWPLIEVFHAESAPRLDDIDVVQPMLFAIQVALAELWQSWGVRPQAVIGHSLGEVAAAHIAGALSLEDAARVICRRSQLMKRVAGKGAMAVVDLDISRAQEALKGFEEHISIAVSNSPRSTVLSGDPAALETVIAQLQAGEIFCRRVKVDVAAHSPHMDALRPELVQALQGIAPRQAAVSLYSTVDGGLRAGPEFDAHYWGQNLRRPVLFAAAVQQALADGFNTFIEISPHPILTQPIEQSIQAFASLATDPLNTAHPLPDPCTLPSLRRNEPELATLLQGLGELYTWGYPVEWERLYPAGRALRLPTYPWQREIYWHELARENSTSVSTVPTLPENPALDEWLYTVGWEAKDRGPRIEAKGPWLLLGQGETAEALAASLQAEGYPCQVATTLPAMQAWQGVVYLRQDEGAAAAWIETIAALGQQPHPPRMWLVTRGNGRGGMGSGESKLAAELWGLGLVAAEEHPDLWGGCIDLDPDLSAGQAAAALLPELLSSDGETQVALYNGQRYVARLARLPKAEKAASPLAWRTDSACLITGGMGGIGLHLAEWLVEQGVRRLVLMGRTPLPSRREWGNVAALQLSGDAASARIAAIRRLEARGASVHLAFVDVGDEAQLTAFLEAYRQEGWPPIRALFHAAGITRDRLLAQMEPADLEAVQHPKATAAWLLHKHLPELEIFVLFSSIGSVLGQVGQGSYAAANAALDALAHYRRSRGLPALSINWGAWADLGLLNTLGGQVVNETLEKQGLRAFSAAEGLEALGQLLHRNDLPPQVAVFPADWSKFQASRKSPAQARFTSALAIAPSGEEASTTPTADLRTTLLALDPRQRCARLEAYLQQQIAQVLKLSAARITPHKPLGTLGLDSLMTIELRNRLEAALGVALPATFVWNYPTIAEMAPFLAEKMSLPLPETAAIPTAPANEAPPPPDGSLEQTLANLSALSDDDALQALLKK